MMEALSDKFLHIVKYSLECVSLPEENNDQVSQRGLMEELLV
jgi:hypothetical protein